MEHKAIIVTNMDHAIQYYSDMFGFKVRLRGYSKSTHEGGLMILFYGPNGELLQYLIG
ncbi:VOC family protein [Neobacillus vireti]|uniref:VOC family protein n=1 Tax=Neobacillus vireti TaxID=220686 RepID=UPI002FFDA5EA